MTIRDRKQMKATAGRRLDSASYLPRRLILIHSGLLLGFALLMAVCDYIITWQIDAKGGGLSGIQMRSILETVSNVLSVAYAVLTPFWTMGLVYAALRLARGQSAYPGVLLEGFRRRRLVIRFVLVQVLIYGLITIVSIYGAWILYVMFTPSGKAFMEALWTLVMAGITDYVALMEQIPPEVIQQVSRAYTPFFCVVFACLVIPNLYRLRLANYLIMENKEIGARKAVRTSAKMMRRNVFQLFLLDLSFCWYYLIPGVLMLLTYADVLAEKLQISLPVDDAVLFLGGNAVYAVLTLAFECFAAPKVVTTYAIFYDILVEEYAARESVVEQEA